MKQWTSRSRLEMEAPEDKEEQSKGQQVLIKLESRLVEEMQVRKLDIELEIDLESYCHS